MLSKVANYKISDNCPTKFIFLKSRQQMLDKAHESLKKAARRTRKYANKGITPLEFHIRDK